MPRNSFPATHSRDVNVPVPVTEVHPIPQGDAGADGGQTGHLPPTGRERTPWRPVAAGIASLGFPVGIGVVHPVLGGALAVIEAMMVLTILGTALFGSRELSERAFRLLRWLGNRPEPPTPVND